VESLLGEVTPDVPISYGQVYSKKGGNLIYVLDKIAARELLTHQDLLKEKSIEVKVV
jgi:glucosamine-6-phosphate deaminase